MKIIQLITRPQRRGAEIFAVQLAERLRILGHEVILISLFVGGGGLDFSGKWIQMELTPSGKLDWKGFRKLAKILDQVSPDLVQCNASDTLRYGLGSRWFARSRFKLVYRNANQMSHFLDSRLKRWWNGFLVRQVDGVASVSELSKTDFLKTFSFIGKIEVLPIGIDGGELELKCSQALPNGFSGPYLLNLGGWVKEKNLQALLRIFARFHSPLEQALSLVLVGEGPEKEFLRDLARTLKIEDRIHFVPNQANPFPILKHAKALVLTPHAEGLPAVILEAMYLGVPVVSFGVGGIPEVVKTGETGWCIAPGDELGFEEALGEVLTMEPDLQEKLNSKAREMVLGNYGLDHIAGRFEKFYKKILTDEG